MASDPTSYTPTEAALVGIQTALERLADHFTTPSQEIELAAALAASTAGFADSLEEILNSDSNMFDKTKFLRQLLEKAREVQSSYAAKVANPSEVGLGAVVQEPVADSE